MNRNLPIVFLGCLICGISVSTLAKKPVNDNDMVPDSAISIFRESGKDITEVMKSISRWIRKSTDVSSRQDLNNEADFTEFTAAQSHVAKPKPPTPNESYSFIDFQLGSDRERTIITPNLYYLRDVSRSEVEVTGIRLTSGQQYNLTFWAKNFFNNVELQSVDDFDSYSHIRSAGQLYNEPRSWGLSVSFRF